MNNKNEIIAVCIILGVLCAGIAVVGANPQILTYNNGYWFNDHNEEINTANIVEYVEISYPAPWMIEVVSPELYYQNEFVYNNGETITIIQGSMTITLTASQTTTLTITP